MRKQSPELHGLSNTVEYKTWTAMRERCFNPNCKEYPYYGGRGISICERWEQSFLAFLGDMGERPEGFSIERIDNDGDYRPGNCKWASVYEQNRNARKNTKKSNNTSGKSGVTWNRNRGTWNASIMVNRKKVHLGAFHQKEDAIRARERAETEHGVNDGE